MNYIPPEYWHFSEAIDSDKPIPDHVMYCIYETMPICPANVFHRYNETPSSDEAQAVWDARVEKGSPLTRYEALSVLRVLHLAKALAA